MTNYLISTKDAGMQISEFVEAKLQYSKLTGSLVPINDNK